MVKLLSQAIRDKDIRKRLLWTLFILIVFRFGAHIVVPGVNAKAMTSLMDQTSLLSLLNVFSGGGLTNYSVMALGVSPYVTAQIVIQLLQLDIVPRFVEWSKQGEVGRRKLNNATRWLTLGIAFVQSIGITAGLNSMSQSADVQLLKSTSWQAYALIGIVMTIGTMFAMWLGEQISDKGLGNGVSMIIFAGIIAQLIPGLWEIFQENVLQSGGDTSGIVFMIILIVSMILIITGVTWFYGATRRLQMQYTRSSSQYGSESYLPLRVNVSGVIPVIFASSFITTPGTILTAFNSRWSSYGWYDTANEIFSLKTTPGAIVYAALIVVFTYFYAFVQVNPEKLADNLQKQGAYIVGVRPGEATKTFMSNLIMRLSFPGSIFLAVVAIIPIIATNIWGLSEKIGLGGTSLLITIGVTLDILRQIDGLMQKKAYNGFIRTKAPSIRATEVSASVGSNQK